MGKYSRYSDIIVAFGVLGILVVMVSPLPKFLLDILITLNISVAVIILLMTLYISRPLDFSVFPSLLLLLTLYRLALNIASTRLILLHGNSGEAAAGDVIKSFGKFVIGGNYVVGGVVFFILVIVQFVVITAGANRIAEVAARFTLDAMPGKQMSIDADLSAGIKDKAQAQASREEVKREADFYGAMDGASKFVKGDAVASVLIIIINIIGGLAIGVFQHAMPIAQAATTYTLLTIGDGLVSQIPALVISTAAGIIVTRTAAKADFGHELASQIFHQPKALLLTASLLGVLGLMPGLPKLPFLFLAALLGGMAYLSTRPQQETSQEKGSRAGGSPVQKEETEETQLEELLAVEPVELEIGYNLIPLVDSIIDKIKGVRKKLAIELGFIVPPVRIRDNLRLSPNAYSLLIKGGEVAGGELMMNQLLAMSSGAEDIEIDGIEAKEPVFGLRAWWIGKEQKRVAETAGYTVIEPQTILITHLSEVLKSHGYELLTRQEIQQLLEGVARSHPAIVDEVKANLPTYIVQKVLQNLLKERVPIKDLITILETLLERAPSTKEPTVLTEYVRVSLARHICKQCSDENKKIQVFTLSPALEGDLENAIKPQGLVPSQSGEQSKFLAVAPEKARMIVATAAKAIEGAIALMKTGPVILCSASIRPYFREFIVRFIPNIAVLSYNEIAPGFEVQKIGEIGMRET